MYRIPTVDIPREREREEYGALSRYVEPTEIGIPVEGSAAIPVCTVARPRRINSNLYVCVCMCVGVHRRACECIK